jgi:hypothetical protein
MMDTYQMEGAAIGTVLFREEAMLIMYSVMRSSRASIMFLG